MPIEIFYSYSHKDEKLRGELEKQLSLLNRQGIIAEWHDRKILAGQEWASKIDTHLNTADIILLLVSPDFMASDYCYSIEMKRAMERHEREEAHVIPIILRPVYWQGAPFGKLQALPTDAKPVTGPDWHSLDEALFDVAEGIRKAVAQIVVKTLSQPIAAHETVPPPQATQPRVVQQRRLPRRLALTILLIFICIGFLSLSILFLHPKPIIPGGEWISPLNGEIVHGTIHFAAYGFPTHSGEPRIDHINFNALWQGVDPRTWKILCVVSLPSQKDIFSCDANPGVLGAPAGPMKISFDVYDQQGNTNYAPNGEHTIIYMPS